MCDLTDSHCLLLNLYSCCCSMARMQPHAHSGSTAEQLLARADARRAASGSTAEAAATTTVQHVAPTAAAPDSC